VPARPALREETLWGRRGKAWLRHYVGVEENSLPSGVGMKLVGRRGERRW